MLNPVPKRSKPKSDSIFVSLKILIFDEFYRSIKDEDFQTDKDKLVETEAGGCTRSINNNIKN